MTAVNEILGTAGALLVILAYIPQIVHIVREHCSGGISKNTWLIWLVASSLLFYYAITIQDMIFIALQTINLIAVIAILILIQTYSARVCHSKEQKFKSR